MKLDPYLPKSAEIMARFQESPTIFSVQCRFSDAKWQQQFCFQPGQFNILYLYGVGEVAISIASDPTCQDSFLHTIRVVGRVTRALAHLKVGDQVGIRGPFGSFWPLNDAIGHDVLIITGGLGCAPTIAAINYLLLRPNDYGHITILQGIKHSDDFIFKDKYAAWQAMPNTTLFIAANEASHDWLGIRGYVTDKLASLSFPEKNTLVFICGPEIMMQVALDILLQKNFPEKAVYFSLERNMECALGHCGHCQLGGLFVCKDGPIFAYPTIKALFNRPGF